MAGKIRIRLKSFDVALVDSSVAQIIDSIEKGGSKISGPIPLPTKIRKVTVLKSPHVNKKSREQFEMRTHKRVIDILEANEATIDALMKLRLPAGVSVDIKS